MLETRGRLAASRDEGSWSISTRSNTLTYGVRAIRQNHGSLTFVNRVAQQSCPPGIQRLTLAHILCIGSAYIEADPRKYGDESTCARWLSESVLSLAELAQTTSSSGTLL